MSGFVRLQSVEQELAPEQEEEGAFPHYKGFWTRASSYFLDTVFFGVLEVVIRYLGWMLLFAVVPVQWLQPLQEYDEAMGAAALLYALISFFMYFAIFEWLYGATLSKIIHKMRVVKTDGAPCGLIAALIRSLMLVVDGFFFGIVAAISMNSPLHQRLGDRLARTVVVAAGDPLIQEPKPWTHFVAVLVLYMVLALGLFVFTVLMMARATPGYSGGASI
jgi:uncharacterized RDD family membrane protein YckC